MIAPNQQESETPVDSPDITPEAVREELRQIINSRHFRSSKRSRQFLEYVVEQKLLGNESHIKERLIGIEIFGRDSNYATGDDPVVRVQAGEVRRRLELYRAEFQDEDGILVELPTGTYVPVFRNRLTSSTSTSTVTTPTSSSASVEVPSKAPSKVPSEPADAIATAAVGSSLQLPSSSSRQVFIVPKIEGPAKSFGFAKVVFSLLLLIIGGAIGYLTRMQEHVPGAVTEFWGPVLSSQKSVVISLGKPFVYAPSARLFEEYAKTHPNAFAKGVDRHNQYLPLDRDTSIPWSDMIPVNNSGPAVGGVRAALTLTSFLGRFGRTFTVRFGDEGSFLELRDSPSIIVGAMNNRWTTDIDNDFHFGIRDNNSYQYIMEQGTNHTWRTEYSDRGARDYGLITREPIGATGQFLVKIAGLQDGGTEAATELVANPEMLQGIVRTLPPHWQSKKLQILVATDMIGRKAGPPQVIAVYAW